ncbi:ATP-dependent DNA helicase RecG [Candidatus Nitrotoga arctica]|uniref:ATP-dependent DNA helicase RecG n=1 Tax=Candidatus Nitrotoga arctica TaxID=453162 RepID=UPI003B968C1B
MSSVFPASIPEATLTKLAKLGIHNRFDLVLHLPLRYEDETRVTQIVELVHGVSTQVEGEIIHSEVMFRPRRSLICQLQDSSGVLHLRFLNFYPSQQKQLEVGKKIRALGEVRMGYFGMEMVHPKCRVAGESTPLKQALTPVYPTTAGLPQATLSKHIQAALNELELSDTLPADLLTRLKLPSFADSVRLLHNPPSDIDEDALLKRTHHAWLRIKFDELLAQQLSMRIHYRKRRSRNAPRLRALGHFTERLLQTLPFSLTTAQQKTLREISRDLEQAHPMQRLLQGDVGSGKTIVALLAALQAIENGYQVALMSPTEILAEQHYHKLRDWLEPLGISPVWLSGSLKKKDKQAAIERIAQGETQLAIGTHALFQDQVIFPKLGLVIVDEQHKFGVQQRLALRGKGDEPHQLMMSATPIPRTLAMSYYADLDVSVIDELPPGRTPVITKLVSDSRREEVLARVRQACLAGQQAYWICPLIDESDTLELQTALETHQRLAQALPDLRVGLVHGKLNTVEKLHAMAAFKTGETHLLVATTVVEVGVDVPNAAMMVIEHAERMGLAQLHQLRGRVGRGAAQSLCILLFQQPLSELARARLKIIYENTDGFEIAQQDLSLRGPGELLGARQSGVPMLRFADVTEDAALLNCAQAVADEMLCDFQQEARAHLQRWMANRQDYLHV